MPHKSRHCENYQCNGYVRNKSETRECERCKAFFTALDRRLRQQEQNKQACRRYYVKYRVQRILAQRARHVRDRDKILRAQRARYMPTTNRKLLCTCICHLNVLLADACPTSCTNTLGGCHWCKCLNLCGKRKG